MRDTDDAARLASLVSSRLTCKRTTDVQQKISIQPWLRIYTTNFDDVHERALFERSIFVDSYSRDGSVQPPTAGRKQIVHLHGYVQETNPTVDPARFVLSLESYADKRLHDSAWLNQFRIDARRASAIFAIGFGYSNQDTHLGNIFLTDESIRSKTAIITHSKAALSTVERLSSFGTVFRDGAEGVSSHLPNSPIKIVISSAKDRVYCFQMQR
ncbi:SIR2 family protein [Bradyrhizobium arachidis]|uniref:SIR2 family protein n=1 Tax=Bradyrhizobium arachidis TaxID=858423 RepID=UPI0022030B24|nr:SIR2 family protein [Bradyrhizobium arachidis]